MTPIRAQMRSLEKPLNRYTGDDADWPSDVSLHATEDSQPMSFRKYIPLGQQIPAFNKLSTNKSQLQQPPRKYLDTLSKSHTDLLNHLAKKDGLFVPIVGGPGTGKTSVMVLATTLAASEPLRRPPHASILKDGGEPLGRISLLPGVRDQGYALVSVPDHTTLVQKTITLSLQKNGSVIDRRRTTLSPIFQGGTLQVEHDAA